LSCWLWRPAAPTPLSSFFPFLKHFRPDLVIHSLLSQSNFGGHLWPLAFVPFLFATALVIVGSSNAVNLTDGLDGLAIGCTVIAAGAFTVLTYVSSNFRWATYLEIQYIPGVGELTVFCGALVGASLGFLWYNAHPAEIFMGDVGSLSLGRNVGDHRRDHQAGDPALFCRRNFRYRSAVGDFTGRLVQATRQAHLPHGAPFIIILSCWVGANRKSSCVFGLPRWYLRCLR